MQQRNKYFSPSLYREALSQLLLPAAIVAALLLVVVMLTTFGEVIARAGSGSVLDSFWWNRDLSELWTFVMFYSWTAPILLTVFGFRFLTSRTKSDFYHALPVERTALFYSYAAAILTWLVASIVTTLSASTMMFVAVGGEVLWYDLHVAVTILVSTIYVASISMFAISLTGTVFSNLVLTGLLLAMPSMAVAYFQYGIVTAIRHANQNFDPFYDLPSFFGSTLNQGLTLLCSFALFAIAAYCFKRRNSEMAGNSAPGPKLQAIYRIAVALPLLLVAFVGIPFYGFIEAPDAFGAVTLTILALVAMASFELITSRRWKNLLKVPLSFGIALGIAVLFALMMWAIPEMLSLLS